MNAGGTLAVMVFSVFCIILFIGIIVGISRWIFRINDIVKRLDQIILLLNSLPK